MPIGKVVSKKWEKFPLSLDSITKLLLLYSISTLEYGSVIPSITILSSLIGFNFNKVSPIENILLLLYLN